LAANVPIPVSLRVFGDTLEPEEVSALLGRGPTRGHRKGDAIADGRASVEPTGAWILESVLPQGCELEEHVEGLLSLLSNDCDEWASLTSRFSASIVCIVDPARQGDALELSPRLSQSLAERGLVIALEFDRRASAT
jgi:hypothetical protein